MNNEYILDAGTQYINPINQKIQHASTGKGLHRQTIDNIDNRQMFIYRQISTLYIYVHGILAHQVICRLGYTKSKDTKCCKK